MLKKKIISVCFLFTLEYVQAQDTQGFFLKDLKPKQAGVHKSYTNLIEPVSASTVNISVDFKQVIAPVSKYLYGNNTNPYMTNIVDQPSLISNIKKLNPQILRYPGGNLSNTFFWNAEPGETPKDVPNTILYGDDRKLKREKFWYGKDENPNTLSLSNYYKVLKQTNTTGIICVNYGYARYGMGKNPVQTAAHLAADWVRYDKGKTKFWEIGNENYGTWQAGYKIDKQKNHDGQPEIISGKIYGEHFKIFADSMKVAAKEIKSEIHIGAVIIETPKERSWEGGIEKNWNKDFFKAAGNAADFFIVHSYYTPYNQNSTAEIILNTAMDETRKMMAYMKQMSTTEQVTLKPVALTEWNIFAQGSKQACSYINGMHAVIVLGELATNKYGMASRWDLANGYGGGNDHGMFSKGDEPGVPLWNPRPAFYYMYYFQKYFGDQAISSSVSNNNQVLCYASKFSSGKAGLIIINKDTAKQVTDIELKSFKPGKRYFVYTLTGGDDNGEFSQKVFVNGEGSKYGAGGPPNLENIKPLSADAQNHIKLDTPPRSVQYILIENNK